MNRARTNRNNYFRIASALLALVFLRYQSSAAPQLFGFNNNNGFGGGFGGGFGNNGGVRFGSPLQQQQKFQQQTPNPSDAGFGGGLFTGGATQQQLPPALAGFLQGNQGQSNGGGVGFGNGQQFGNTASGGVGPAGTNSAGAFSQQQPGANQFSPPQQTQQFGQQQQLNGNGQLGTNGNSAGNFQQPQQVGNQLGQLQQPTTFGGQVPASNTNGLAGQSAPPPTKNGMDDGMTGNPEFDDDAKLLDTFHNSFLPRQNPQQVLPGSSQVPTVPAQISAQAQSQAGQQQQQQLTPTAFRQQQLQARLRGGDASQQQVPGGSQLDGRLLFSNNIANRRPGDVSTVLATQAQQSPTQGQAAPQGDALGSDELAALQNAGIDPTQVALGDGSSFSPPQANRFRRPPPTLTAGGGGIAVNGPDGSLPTLIPAAGRRPMRPPMPPRGRRPRPPPPPPPTEDGSSDGPSTGGDERSASGGNDDAPFAPSAHPGKGGKQLDPTQFGLPPGTIILGEQNFDSGESEVDEKGHSASDTFVPPPLKKAGKISGRIEGDEPDAMKKLIAQLKALTSPGSDATPAYVKGSARNAADDAPAAKSSATTAVPTVQDSLQQALAKQPPAEPASASPKPTSVTL